MSNYNELAKGVFDVGSCQPRSFEDGLEILNIEFSYTEESEIPKGYQFYTSGDYHKLMPGWKPVYSLELGLADYTDILGNE